MALRMLLRLCHPPAAQVRGSLQRLLVVPGLGPREPAPEVSWPQQSAVVPGMEGLGLSLSSRSQGGGQGQRNLEVSCLPPLPPCTPRKGASQGSLPILGLESLVVFPTDSCPLFLLLSLCYTFSLRTNPHPTPVPQDTSASEVT